MTGPPEVVIKGKRFIRAKVREKKDGVVDQYREDRLFSSRHAYLLEDGSFRIDHTDLVNPDRGKIAAGVHFVADHPMGRALGTLGGVVLVRKFIK